MDFPFYYHAIMELFVVDFFRKGAFCGFRVVDTPNTFFLSVNIEDIISRINDYGNEQKTKINNWQSADFMVLFFNKLAAANLHIGRLTAMY